MRPSKDDYCLAIAAVVATRSTCLRRAVGCVVTNARGRILATGHNGVAAGLPHCNEPKLEGVDYRPWGDPKLQLTKPEKIVTVYPHACEGAAARSGTNLDACEAIHAEQNALLTVADVFAIDTVYVTVTPCVSCTKLLLGTSARRIVAAGAYPSSGEALWRSAGREWVVVSAPGVESAANRV